MVSSQPASFGVNKSILVLSLQCLVILYIPGVLYMVFLFRLVSDVTSVSKLVDILTAMLVPLVGGHLGIAESYSRFRRFESFPCILGDSLEPSETFLAS